jgi:HSP20 family protein
MKNTLATKTSHWELDKAFNQWPSLFGDNWFANTISNMEKVFDIPNAVFPYNVRYSTENNQLKEMIVEVALAGIGKDNINVNVQDNKLLVSINKEEEVGAEYFRRGISHRKGQLSFRLNDNVDVKSIKSSYKDGLLRVTLPVIQKQTAQNIDITVD